MALSKTARFYNANPEAKKKKAKYDKENNKTSKDYRAELGRLNYEKDKKDGKNSRKGLHYDHKTKKWVKAVVNQSRPEEKWKNT